MPTDAVIVGDDTITEMFLQEMGIKEAYMGDEPIYQRKGGYFYLILNTKETE